MSGRANSSVYQKISLSIKIIMNHNYHVTEVLSQVPCHASEINIRVEIFLSDIFTTRKFFKLWYIGIKF